MNRHRLLPFFCALLVLSAGAGCKNPFANFGTGSHMDAPRERTKAPAENHRREMVVEVTTDPEGNVVEVHFQRSSGKEGLDAYVADTIRQGWPRQPSTKSVAAITYEGDKGFSEPRILSTAPVR